MSSPGEESAVRRAFSGRSVLVTGGTGFLGMLITEKILRAIPDIKKVYILARSKRNVDAEKRVQILLDNEIFHIVKQQTPDFRRRVCALEGDVSEVGLGLSQENRRLLTEEVHFIFHGAATVRFDEMLRRSVTINVHGTREMLLLAKDCRKLQAFVHISTGFCNTPYTTTVEEKFYKSHIDAKALIAIVESIDDATASKITQSLIESFPNTYSFTKNITENMLLDYASDLPIAIVRPCAVISCDKEPLPGWINNMYGPGGLLLGTFVGLLHVAHVPKDIIADILPADYVVNTCIASAWKTATDKKTGDGITAVDNESDVTANGNTVIANGNGVTANGNGMTVNGNNVASNGKKMAALDDKMEEPIIYTVGSSWRNPVTWNLVKKYFHPHVRDYPYSSTVSYPWLYMTSSETLAQFLNIFLILIPAIIADWLGKMRGDKPKFFALYEKLKKFKKTTDFWLNDEWRFNDDNTVALINSMSLKDRDLFNCDVATWDLKSYGKSYVLGLRRYLMKESDATIPAAKRLRKKFALIHYTICLALLMSVLYVVYSLCCKSVTIYM